MGKYITAIDVSLDEAEEQLLKSRGFDKINVDLNKGAGGNFIYLWYKKGDVAPITRMQVSFSDDMSSGLIKAGYQMISKNLNAGAKGDTIYLWYYSGSTEYDTPIVDLNVTVNGDEESPKYQFGWERVGCDLNRRAGGNYIYAWVKREKPTYICDIFASDSSGLDPDLFNQGYTRVDEDINREAGGPWVFIWYRRTTSTEKALSRLEVSTNDSEYHSLQQQGYQIVNVNLNEGTGGDKVYLWYKRDAAHNPVQALSVLVNAAALELYMKDGHQKDGHQVIKKNLNSGNRGVAEYLAFYQ